MYEELVGWLRSWSELPAHCECYESCEECNKQDICATFTNESIIAKAREAAEAIEELSKPRWVHVTERLPESGGSYIVYLRPFKGKTDTDYVIGDLSYPTEMYFDKGQMLWVGENESYNAILSAVDTENEYHVTHWMPLPEPPEEDYTE